MKGHPGLAMAYNSDRFIRCASCRSTATYLINRVADGRTLYSSCPRHVRGHLKALNESESATASPTR